MLARGDGWNEGNAGVAQTVGWAKVEEQGSVSCVWQMAGGCCACKAGEACDEARLGTLDATFLGGSASKMAALLLSHDACPAAVAVCWTKVGHGSCCQWVEQVAVRLHTDLASGARCGWCISTVAMQDGGEGLAIVVDVCTEASTDD